MTAFHSGARSVVALVVVVLLLLRRVSFGQESAAIPAFPTGAEAITADVVVLDKDGRPVRGLTLGDFTFLVDGAPQRIVGFEARELATTPAAAATTVGDERVATNEGGTKGRTFVFLLDDVGDEFAKRHHQLQEAKRTIVRWLDEKAQPSDELTLTTVSGAQWWSDRIDRGRADFMTVLDRVRIHSTWERIRTGPGHPIESLKDPPGAGMNRIGEATRAAMGGGNDQGSEGDALNPDLLSGLAQRVADRTEGPGQNAESTGRRVGAVLETTERLSNSLTGVRGRKSILIFSDGIPNINYLPLFDRVVGASQRANTAVYFVDVKGLGAPELYRAEDRNGVRNLSDGRPEAAELGARSMYENYIATAGLEMVAENTGGATIRDTNDLLGGVDKIAEESSTYYLLGYQPDKAPDGKWHKLEVKVSRPGVKVRMRRGYQALLQVSTPSAPATQDKAAKHHKKGPKRPMDPAVLTSGAADALLLRLAPYVLDRDKTGLARILVVLELDTSRLSLRSDGQRRTGAIDLTLVGMSRDLDKVFPLDERVRIDLEEKAAGGWMSLTRELRLPVGVAQVRVLARDAASGLAGAVAARLEIPSLDRPYLATPILTDRMITGGGQGPRLMPVAHRLFKPKGYLFCSYEVVGMTNARGEATMQVEGGFTLRRSDGQIVSQSAPTRIATALGGRVSRLFALPLAGMEAGEYELVLDVMDEATGRTLQSREAFVVGPV